MFRARGLTKVYDMGEVRVQALRGIDLDLYASELVVMLGASGSGKSTLLNILGGLDRATEGTVRYHDKDLTGASEKALTDYRRYHVGFVFQFYNLIPSLTARENVSIVTEIAREPMRPEEALQLVGLGDRMDHFPSQLSGGQQQRVAIARALMQEPKMILADEPVASLDPVLSHSILKYLELLNKEDQLTVLCSLHFLDLVHRYATHAIALKDGQVVFQGLPQEIDDAQFKAIYGQDAQRVSII